MHRYFYEVKNLRAACDPGRRLDANFNFHLFIALNGKDRENKGFKVIYLNSNYKPLAFVEASKKRSPSKVRENEPKTNKRKVN